MNNLYSDNESYQLESLNKESLGPGLYMLDISKKILITDSAAKIFKILL